jgi:hypothetical protein
MAVKPIITPEDFDNLPDIDKMRYLYCPECQFFYLAVNEKKHLCIEREY